MIMVRRILIASLVFISIQVNGQRILVVNQPFNYANDSSLTVLEEALSTADEVVVLGDFLNRKTVKKVQSGENLPAATLLLNFPGQIHWVPGKEEWGAIRGNAADNLQFLKQQLNQLDTSWILVNANACPGPITHRPSDNLALVFINTSWWLHEGTKPDPAECSLEDISGFFVALNEELAALDSSKVIVIGYHPLVSNGPHGGYFPASAHLLPPVVGSLYVLYRKAIGGRQDLTNYYYESMKNDLLEVFAKYPDITYLSSLEGSFQHFPNAVPEQVIVGTMGRTTFTRPRQGVITLEQSGLFMLQAEKDEISAEYHSPNKKVVPVALKENVLTESGETFTRSSFPDTITARATDKLHRDQKKPGLLGKNYRGEWEALIDSIPVFDLEKEGLKIIKQGGGQQTKSLRLEAGDGHQYVLRSIEKFPEKAVPAELRSTVAADVVADLISASHPYAAFVIPSLANAAGVYHTNPQLVYLPDDPRLGKYRYDFGGGLYLFEERPDDDWRGLDSFGNSKKIMSTADVIEKLQNDGDHIIDQEQTVRSRLFDIWIGDWDRHDDQWRWARFKPENEHDLKYYQPIPRDRDQAFFWSDGTLLRTSTRRWGQPKFQGFHDEIRDVAGLEFNARYFDRTFLTGADKDLWLSVAEDLQQRLTDLVIDSAIREFPSEIYALHGKEIRQKLKKRRDDLRRYAEEYYLFLSETVTLTASDKDDLIEVKRSENGAVSVEIFRIKGKEREKKYRYYTRLFQPDETNEIRIYAFGDDDLIRITGTSDKGPLLRIIGGKGDDVVMDESRVRGLSDKTIVYDKTGTEIHSKGEVKNKLSDRESINRYDRYAFQFNTTMPLVTGGFNPDDGLFLGGGFSAIRHGFRKESYKVRHRVLVSVAPRSGSYNLSYDAHFVELLGQWDLRIGVDIFEPSYADFFYGFGNQTDFNEDIFEEDNQFYRVRYGQWILKPLLSRSLNNRIHTIAFGPTFRSVEIEADENEDGERFISLYADFVGRGADSESPLLETRRNYLGLQANYQLDLRDNQIFPLNGLLIQTEVSTVKQVNEEENLFHQLTYGVSFYKTFGAALRTTLAVRVGGQYNTGTYEFYQAARLGGQNQIRGYRKFRFAGEKTFYNNLELRTRILTFNSFLFPAELGLTLFHDIGRVWEDSPDLPVVNENKEQWHRGYGAGIWLAPLGRIVISADYGVTNDDENAFFLRFGFMF
jgi:hypothetical protein